MAILLFIGPCRVVFAPYLYRNAIDDPMGQQKSLVYDVYGEFAVRGVKVHVPSVRKMFNTGVKMLSGKKDLKKAWRQFVHDDDIIALKFTYEGGKELGTNYDVCAGLLQSLYAAGFKPEQIMVVGLDMLPKEAEGTIPWEYGWQDKKADFHSDSDYLASWLDKVTAIINVPSVMDDNIIGLRCSLANLSWSVVKSPARLYIYSQGDPFVPDIYELPQVKGKVRLHVANGLRILYFGGPIVKQMFVYEHGSLILSTDPVALDKVCLELLRGIRRDRGVPTEYKDQLDKLDVSYLETAQAMGIGYADLNFIDLREMRHER